SALLDGGSFASGGTLAGEGRHTLVVSALDHAGNQASAQVSFTIDKTPPQLLVSAPLDGARIAALQTTVSGTIADASPVTLTVAGVAVPVVNGAFSTSLALQQGANSVSVVTTDAAGNSSTVIRAVRANTTPPKLQLSAPVSGLVTSLTTMTVGGQDGAGDPIRPP